MRIYIYIYYIEKHIYIYIYVVNTKEVSAILSNLTRLHKSEKKTHDYLSTFLARDGDETTPQPKYKRTSPSTSERSEFARKRKAESKPNQERLSLYQSNHRNRMKIGKASFNIYIYIHIHSYIYIHIYTYTSIYIYVYICLRIMSGLACFSTSLLFFIVMCPKIIDSHK